MLEIVLRLDATAALSATKGRPWIAEANLDGTTFDARSHNGASYALARKLVEAGVHDRPVRVSQGGIAGFVEWPSLHWLATRTIAESTQKPIDDVRWKPFSKSNLAEDVSPPDA